MEEEEEKGKKGKKDFWLSRWWDAMMNRKKKMLCKSSLDEKKCVCR